RRSRARCRDAGGQAPQRSESDLIMAILVIAEHEHGSLKAATRNTVTAGLRCGDDLHVLIAGHDVTQAAEEAARIQGVRKVLVADAPQFAEQLAENIAAQVLAI